MMFNDSIRSLLLDENFVFKEDKNGSFHVFKVDVGENHIVDIIPIQVCSVTLKQAESQMIELSGIAGETKVIVAEDLWWSRNGMMRQRLLAQLGRFRSVFARNTEVRRINKQESSAFLSMFHTYGDASSRYRYGIFSKDGEMVAAACFSSPRRWLKDKGYVRSYEWVRYASLPGVRVVGGMGKVLKYFIENISPDDVMSYADLEWTSGAVYETLGFERESFRRPVLFAINPETWLRTPVNGNVDEGMWYHYNLGSVKYRLKL